MSCLQENDEEKASGKVTTYTVLVLEKNSVQISNLSPSTVYLFKVQALSSEGNSGSYSVEQEFSTLPEGKQNENVCFYIYNYVFIYLFSAFLHFLKTIWDQNDIFVAFNSLDLRPLICSYTPKH